VTLNVVRFMPGTLKNGLVFDIVVIQQMIVTEFTSLVFTQLCDFS